MKEPFKMNFSLYEYHSLFNHDIQVSYKGPIDERILSVIGNYIEVILVAHPSASKKIFKIFIELAQNISYYSAEKNIITKDKQIGAGTLVIGEFGEFYTFITGNLVKNDDVIILLEKCDIINSLDRDALRQYKREQRKLPQGERGGGNIGLIQVALTAACPLDVEVTPVDDDYSFFSIAVKVSKEGETDNELKE